MWPATGARLAMCPIWRFSTARHRSPSAFSLSLQYTVHMMEAAGLMKATCHLKERVGGAQGLLCATPARSIRALNITMCKKACAKCVPGRVHSCCASHLSNVF